MVEPSAFQIQAQKIGAVILEARSAMSKSEEDGAHAMGLSVSEYHAFERGEKGISLPELEVLAFYLDIPVDHFLGRETISLVEQEKEAVSKLESLLPLRHRIIGVMLYLRTRVGLNLHD